LTFVKKFARVIVSIVRPIGTAAIYVYDRG